MAGTHTKNNRTLSYLRLKFAWQLELFSHFVFTRCKGSNILQYQVCGLHVVCVVIWTNYLLSFNQVITEKKTKINLIVAFCNVLFIYWITWILFCSIFQSTILTENYSTKPNFSLNELLKGTYNSYSMYDGAYTFQKNQNFAKCGQGNRGKVRKF